MMEEITGFNSDSNDELPSERMTPIGATSSDTDTK
jgi:hypothetical protein